MATATTPRPKSRKLSAPEPEPARYFQVVRIDAAGNIVDVYSACMDAVRSRVTIDTYNSLPGDFRLMRRPVDLSRLPADAYGEFET